MKKIMTRAWEIYRTLTNGTRLEKLSTALKAAWNEVKNMAKKAFEKTAKVARAEETYGESYFLTFNAWEKGGKRRIYINDYKKRTLGYIDRENGEVIINDRQGMFQSEIDFAINTFFATYAI